MAEIRRSGTWGSALSADEFAAIRSAGFEPVGQVLGAAVYNIGYTGGYGCPGAWARLRRLARGRTERHRGVRDAGSGYGSFGPLVQTHVPGAAQAIGRMTEECAGTRRARRGRGLADHRRVPRGRAGVQGDRHGGAGARRRRRCAQPFTSDLSGQDFAKLIMAGWVPAGLALGISIGGPARRLADRRPDPVGGGQRRGRGYTDLVNPTRHDARHAAGAGRDRLGADGVVVQEHGHAGRERECPIQEHRRDHIVEATIIGTAIARFGSVARTGRSRPLAILSLDPQRRQAARVQLAPERACEHEHNDRHGTIRGEPMTDQQGTELERAGRPAGRDAQRLAELRPGRPGSIFTSDLSVNEFLLVREVGFRPLGLVLGSSIYHVGLQVGRWGKNQELDVLSQAMYHARELAMTRMEAEADALGADGIVGVRLDVEMKEFGADIAEFIAVGHRGEGRAGRGRRRREELAQQQEACRSPPTCPARTSGR